jgi:hypothetical protein
MPIAQGTGMWLYYTISGYQQNGKCGMTIWQNGSICIEKTDMLEVEENWFLFPGEVIFERPTELPNMVISGSHVWWGNRDRLDNSSHKMTGKVGVA